MTTQECQIETEQELLDMPPHEFASILDALRSDLTEIKADIARIDQKLDSELKAKSIFDIDMLHKVNELNATVFGDRKTDGLRGKVDQLIEADKQRRKQFWVIFGIVMSIALQIIASYFGFTVK